MQVELIEAYKHQKEIKELFSEYTNLLIEGDKTFQKYLEVQNYEKELGNLQLKYGKPDGRLYILFVDKKAAGCIGLKKINSSDCEMKRLYVRSEFRGNHLSELLVNQIIKDAKDIGYKYMLLDTLPFLKSAIRLYKKYGFYEVECYNNSPMDSSIYMKLEL